jgi:hypothetical protein
MGNLVASQDALKKKHAKEIKRAWDNVGRSMWDYLVKLNEAWGDLEHEINGKEFAAAVGISAAQLSKHLKIARNELIIENKRRLPATETSLYILAQIYDDCRRVNRNDPDKKFLQIVQRSSAEKTIEFFKNEREKIRASLRRVRGKGVLSLNDETHAAPTKGSQLSWNAFISSKQVYSTFFINCTSEFLDLASSGEDFIGAFPIANKRAPSQTSQNHCFVFAPTNRIMDALVVLDSCGFSLHQIYSTTKKPDVLGIIGEQILLHGIYGGRRMNNVSQIDFTPTLEGAISLAETFGDKSRILFFANGMGSGWSHCSPSASEIEGIF